MQFFKFFSHECTKFFQEEWECHGIFYDTPGHADYGNSLFKEYICDQFVILKSFVAMKDGVTMKN